MSISSSGDIRSFTLVKLGGSLLTDKRRPESAREAVLERLACEVAAGLEDCSDALILGHGSGSFGHVAAARHGFAPESGEPPTAVAIAATQDAAARLHRRVIAALLEAAVRPYSLVPGSAFVTDQGRAELVNGEALDLATGLGLLPVVYGDVVCDRSRGATILSTEAVFITLVEWLRDSGREVREVLWLGETSGVLDDAGRTISVLDDEAASALAASVHDAEGTDVTGGMGHRLETAARLARLGITSRIVDGRVDGLLARSLAGQEPPGTLIVGSKRGA